MTKDERNALIEECAAALDAKSQRAHEIDEARGHVGPDILYSAIVFYDEAAKVVRSLKTS